jgi:hypothetical protein
VDELGVSKVGAVGEERSVVGVRACEAEPVEELGSELDGQAGVTRSSTGCTVG